MVRFQPHWPLECEVCKEKDALAMSTIEAGSLGGWMETYTGKQFYPLKPRSEDVDAIDIAHALAHICRYNGHSKFLYSVAMHCCVLSDYVYRESNDPHATLLALLHDASEAYCGDMVRPLKYRLAGYRELEDEIQACVYRAFKIAPDPAALKWIKNLDSQIVQDERRQVMLTRRNEWATDKLKPLGVEIRPMPPEIARINWLSRLYWHHFGFDPTQATHCAHSVFNFTGGNGE
jgi:hypothetical protein